MDKVLLAVFATICSYTLAKLHAHGDLPALLLLIGCMAAVFYGNHKL